VKVSRGALTGGRCCTKKAIGQGATNHRRQVGSVAAGRRVPVRNAQLREWARAAQGSLKAMATLNKQKKNTKKQKKKKGH